jgi:hypothetical protein
MMETGRARILNGVLNKPYTWNGRSSWILDETPDSGLNLAGDASIPSQIQPPTKPDDATNLYYSRN